MESKAKLFGHPIHQMLVVFPLGLLATAAIFDVIHLITDGSGWALASYYLIGAGVIGGLAAAVFGLIDYLAIPKGTRARRIGAVHGVGNVFVVGLFGMSFYMRIGTSAYPPGIAIGLAIFATILALVTGWLGGELVNRLAVGVDDGANLNAPSSLKGPVRSSDDHRMAAD
jgi:uncharacterized membrane protein